MIKKIALSVIVSIGLVFSVGSLNTNAMDLSLTELSKNEKYKTARVKMDGAKYSMWLSGKEGYYFYGVLSSYLDPSLPDYHRNIYYVLASPIRLDFELISDKKKLAIKNNLNGRTEKVYEINGYAEVEYTLDGLSKGAGVWNNLQTGYFGIDSFEYLGRLSSQNAIKDSFNIGNSLFYEDTKEKYRGSVSEWEKELGVNGFKYLSEVYGPFVVGQGNQQVVITSPYEFSIKGLDNGGYYGDTYLSLDKYSNGQIFRFHYYEYSDYTRTGKMVYKDATAEEIKSGSTDIQVFKDVLSYDVDYGNYHLNTYSPSSEANPGDGIDEETGSVLSVLGKFFNKLFGFFGDIFVWLGDFFQQIFDLIWRLFIPNDDYIDALFEEFSKSVDGFFGPIGKLINDIEYYFYTSADISTGPRLSYDGRDIFEPFRNILNKPIAGNLYMGNYGSITFRGLIKATTSFLMIWAFIMWFLRRWGGMTKGEVEK